MALPGLVLPSMVEVAVLPCAKTLGVAGLDYNWKSVTKSLVKQQEVLTEPQVAVPVRVAERFREFVFPIVAQVLERKPYPGWTRCRKRLYKT